MNDAKETEKRIEASVGESVRTIRVAQGLGQKQLSVLTGIPLSILAEIESDSIGLSNDRAKVLARALKCHPGVLVFPGWDIECEDAALKIDQGNKDGEADVSVKAQGEVTGNFDEMLARSLTQW
jgi:transcriptional regulator with XRE-family HTH domain